jgi:hypothetical protein
LRSVTSPSRTMSSARVQRSHQERGDGAVPLYPLSRTSRAGGSARTARSGRRTKQELPEEQKKELKEAFELFDTDKVGSIDYHELKVLMRALGFQVTKREVMDLVEDVDVQCSGRVDFNDYMEISTRRSRLGRRCGAALTVVCGCGSAAEGTGSRPGRGDRAGRTRGPLAS